MIERDHTQGYGERFRGEWLGRSAHENTVWLGHALRPALAVHRGRQAREAGGVCAVNLYLDYKSTIKKYEYLGRAPSRDSRP